MKNIVLWICLLCFFIGNPDVYAQKEVFTVTGKVIDTSGEPLVGVNVSVEGNERLKAVTNIEGEYVINLLDKKGVLLFSYIGMKDMSVSVKGMHTINVTLEDDEVLLDEVVAIGYGSAKRSDLTGTVSSISGKDLVDMPSSSLEEALQGRLPGLVITSSSGDLEADVQVRVRGGISITQDNSPLYIVDGFPMEKALSMLDPNEVESIDVLKDASATAIYGSRGANGVIIIKTKSGRKNVNTISYNMTMKFTGAAGDVALLSPIEYLKFDYQRTENIENWESRYGPIKDIYINYADAKGVDWQEEMLGQKSLSHKHVVGINGGGERIQYNLSYIYDKVGGVMQQTGRKKHSLRFSLNNSISERLSFGLTAAYYMDTTDGNGAYAENGSQMFNIFRYKPVLGIYEKDDDVYIDPNDPNADAIVANPHTMMTSRLQKTKKTNANVNFKAIYTIMDGLKYSIQFGMIQGKQERKNFYRSNSGQAIQAGGPLGTVDTQDEFTMMGNHTLEYQKKFKNSSKFDVMIGQEIRGYDYKRLMYGAHGFPEINFGLDNMAMGTLPDQFKSDKHADRSVSFFGRTNYQISKYLFTFTMRADGSSKFSRNNKWGYFPAGAVAWRLNEEPFIKKLDIFHNLKLRLSYGLTGNNRISDYQFWSLMTSSYMLLNNTASTTYLPTLGNDDLKWETNITANIGLDMAFLKGRIGLVFDMYQTDTKNLLMNANLQPSSGYTVGVRNVGATRNRGMEIMLTTHNVKTKNFNWHTSLSLSFNKAIIKELANTKQWFINSKTNRNDSVSYFDYVYEVGLETGTYYGFIYDGLYQADEFNFDNGIWTLKDGVVDCEIYPTGPQPGYAKYRNLNPDEDNVVTSRDRTYIGKANPVCNGGLTNTFTYKNFKMSLFCIFKLGGKIYNGNIYNYLYPGNGYSSSKYVYQNMYTFLDNDGTRLIDTGNTERLMELNRGKIYPRVGGIPFSTLLLENASFFRFANVNISYSVPRKWLQTVKLKEAIIGFSVQNLGIITSYTGYDPEVSMNRNNGLTPGIDKGSMPRNRTYTFDLKVQF